MKMIDGLLYLYFDEMLSCGISSNTMLKAKQRSSNSWQFIEDPSDRRKILIDYKHLRDNYKEAIQKRFGNPYDYHSKEPIKKLVEKDFKAEAFFLSYTFEGGKKLPREYVQKYTQAASWLNMIVKVDADSQIVKKGLGLKMDNFWKSVCEIIESESIDLPSSYRRLAVNEDSALKKYKATGYTSLISSKFGNQNAAKITDDIAKDVLLDIIGNHNQHDDTIILMAYNSWATKNDKKPILSYQTIGNFRRENEYLIKGEREGNAAFYNKFGKVIKGRRPSAPLLLVEHDDNDLDKYFKDGSNNYFRFKLIVVRDAYKDYPLGWAAGDEVSIELIQAAYLDAMHHIHDLTGGWYLPHQIKSDRWGIDSDLTTTLARFYKKIDPDFFPAAIKNPRGKYIESSFGTKWHQLLKLDNLNNYAGTNITSRSRINADALDANKKNFPDKQSGLFYIDAFMNAIRSQKNAAGVTLTDEWTAAFQQSELSQERKISRTNMLLTFGSRHIVPQAKNPEYPNCISNYGLQLQIANNEYCFDIPDELYLQNVGRQVQVVYDPLDMTNVLVHDGKALRFVAQEMKDVSRARVEQTDEDKSRYWKRMHQKRMHMQLVAEAAAGRKNRLKGAGINSGKLLTSMIDIPDPEALLQAGVLTKELKQAAEGAYQQKNGEWAQIQNDYLTSKVDFNDYTD